MSIKTILNHLENLILSHETLLKLSVEKTEIVKEGATEKLQALLIQERKCTRQLEQAELKRKEAVDEWFIKQSLPIENATITKMLELLTDQNEKNKLETITDKLTEVILELKQQELLNQALIQQSLQFVQLNLDIMSPSLKNLNYGKQKEVKQVNRSVFDSKA